MGYSSTKPDPHRCEWREAYEGVAPTIEELQRKMAVLAAQYEELKRLHFGKKSERKKPSKLPPAVPPLNLPFAPSRETGVSMTLEAVPVAQEPLRVAR